ncbi:MAG: PD-(D/E)XK nuclease family protein, partial [Sphingopyxis sp.]
AAAAPKGFDKAKLTWSDGASGGAGGVPLAGPVPKILPQPLQDLIDRETEREAQEHWRLLYVAMTRAERMLFVAGAEPTRGKVHPANWYDQIAAAVAHCGGVNGPVDGPWGQELAYRVGGSEPARGAARRAAPATAPLPGWALAMAAPELRPSRPLAPSALGDGDALDVPQAPRSASASAAADRGRLMHALFERLPAVAPPARRDAALAWLARTAPAQADHADAMVQSVLRVMGDPAFAPVFAPDALAEAPFSALVDGRVIAGTIDRLLVTADAVHAVDFKTGAHVPSGPDDVPVGYARQMAAYSAALAVIFPGRRVQTSLLFTAGPAMIHLSPEWLARHKPVGAATGAVQGGAQPA